MNMLYQKHNYIDRNISYLCSRDIYEYDIKSAGFNLLKYYQLVDKEMIQMLEDMSKHQRKIKIGLLMREDRELGKKLSDCFVDMRRRFFEANELKEEDILSIKRDAIFTLKYCPHTIFGNVEFDIKNYYSSYFYLNRMQFFYYKGVIDVKGFAKYQALHEPYMLSFLAHYIHLMETGNRENLIKFIKRFIHLYKTKQLDIGYYREMNAISCFKTKYNLFDQYLYMKHMGDYDNVVIDYNYLHYIIPLAQILI